MGKRSITVLLTFLLAAGLLGIGSLRKETAVKTGGDVAAKETGELKTVALTFDDGPHPAFTKKLLDGLKERNVKATFFLIGRNIEGREALVKQMEEDGHLIGSHTYNHVQLTRVSPEEACREIEATNEAISEITGEKVIYIRPPFGSWDSQLECGVDMQEIGWNVDPQDWKVKNTESVAKHVLSHVEDGSIILLHDVYDTSVEAAFQIIDALKKEGYIFVTADGLLLD